MARQLSLITDNDHPCTRQLLDRCDFSDPPSYEVDSLEHQEYGANNPFLDKTELLSYCWCLTGREVEPVRVDPPLPNLLEDFQITRKWRNALPPPIQTLCRRLWRDLEARDPYHMVPRYDLSSFDRRIGYISGHDVLPCSRQPKPRQEHLPS